MLRAVLRALAIAVFLALNLTFWGTIIFFGGVAKALTFGNVRRRVVRRLPWFAERWVDCNDAMFDLLLRTRWEIDGADGLRRDAHYLVLSNHVSWVDIFAVLRAFQGRAPFIRFFIKRPLMWAPIAGQAAWAMDFPFMRRYTPEYLAQHPEKRGRDLETTRIACRRFRNVPVSILNFAEGTRFAIEKHEEQEAPYRYLLRPRIGGSAFVLASFAEQLDALLDVTLIYPKQNATMLDFVMNRLPWVRVEVRRIEVPVEFRTDAITEPGPARDHFKAWIEQIWREKDERIAQVLAARQS
jgi:1-acyl-sn-glycerol-3-phosphate acyltransferase